MKLNHAVDAEGQVYCAKEHKRIDVISCYGCTKVVEIDLDSRSPKVTCALDRVEEDAGGG